MKKKLGILLLSAAQMLISVTAVLAQPVAATATVFENVKIFDGTKLTAPMNVLVEGNQIAKITSEPIDTDIAVTRIAGEGRTLMTVIIDAHWHTFMTRPPIMLPTTSPFSFYPLI